MTRASEETDGPGMMGVRCMQGESSSINSQSHHGKCQSKGIVKQPGPLFLSKEMRLGWR